VKSVLCYYALSGAALEPVGEMCLLGHFSHGVFSSGRGGETDGLSQMSRMLADAMGDCGPAEQITRFAQGAARLGMTPVDGVKGGGSKWRYHLLPKVPVEAVFYEADDEYPVDMRVYYDKTAIQVFDFEPLAVLNACFIHAVAESCRK
jgi:hypothetical protein